MKILIPVDGSAYGEAAVRYVAARCAESGWRPQIDVLNVQPAVPPGAWQQPDPERIRAWQEAEAENALKPAVGLLRAAHLDPASFHEVGNPGRQIAQWAESHGTDLIVMGSHGCAGRLHVLMGSVAEAVLHDCRTPVLLLRPDTPPGGAALRVGLALDGSEHSAAALEFVIAHQAFFGPGFELKVVHVVDELPAAARAALVDAPESGLTIDSLQGLREAEFERVMQPAREALQSAGLAAGEEMVVASNPGAALAEWARRRELDMLVMGSHGMTVLKQLVLGSVAAGVGARCRTPLLLVRPS